MELAQEPKRECDTTFLAMKKNAEELGAGNACDWVLLKKWDAPIKMTEVLKEICKRNGWYSNWQMEQYRNHENDFPLMWIVHEGTNQQAYGSWINPQ